MTAPVRDVPGLGEWRCRRCNRYLARIVGDRFERPNGDSARLPAVVRCKCGTRNVYLLGAGMSEIEGVTCFECGRARTADPTDGYEAWADGDQQGWICRLMLLDRIRPCPGTNPLLRYPQAG